MKSFCIEEICGVAVVVPAYKIFEVISKEMPVS